MFEYDGPRYRLIMDRYKEKIFTGELKAGDRMPTVRALAETWKVSHATATKALRELCREGYAYVRGNATYVRERGQAEVTIRIPIHGGLRRKKAGLPPSYPGLSEVAEAGIVPAPDYVSDVMGLDRDTPVLRREVVLRIKTKPAGTPRPQPGDAVRAYCLYVSWHPAEFAVAVPGILTTGTDDATSPTVYTTVAGQLAEDALGRTPRIGLDSFHGRTADEREARLLGIAEGDPVMARILTWDDEDGVTEYMECVYPLGVVVSFEHIDPDEPDEE